MYTEPAPSRRYRDIFIYSLIRRATSSPRLPFLVLRDLVAYAGQLGALRVEDMAVSPAAFAALRDGVRAWAHHNGEPANPDLYPSCRCDSGVPHNTVRVWEVSR